MSAAVCSRAVLISEGNSLQYFYQIIVVKKIEYVGLVSSTKAGDPPG